MSESFANSTSQLPEPVLIGRVLAGLTYTFLIIAGIWFFVFYSDYMREWRDEYKKDPNTSRHFVAQRSYATKEAADASVAENNVQESDIVFVPDTGLWKRSGDSLVAYKTLSELRNSWIAIKAGAYAGQTFTVIYDASADTHTAVPVSYESYNVLQTRDGTVAGTRTMTLADEATLSWKNSAGSVMQFLDNATGYVGFGTNDPQVLVDVRGTANVDALRLTGTDVTTDVNAIAGWTAATMLYTQATDVNTAVAVTTNAGVIETVSVSVARDADEAFDVSGTSYVNNKSIVLLTITSWKTDLGADATWGTNGKPVVYVTPSATAGNFTVHIGNADSSNNVAGILRISYQVLALPTAATAE